MTKEDSIMRQLIRNGKIYDGTGSEPFTGDT